MDSVSRGISQNPSAILSKRDLSVEYENSYVVELHKQSEICDNILQQKTYFDRRMKKKRKKMFI